MKEIKPDYYGKEKLNGDECSSYGSAKYSFRNLFLVTAFVAILVASLSISGSSELKSEENLLLSDNLIAKDEMNTIEKALWENRFEKSSEYYNDQLPKVRNSRNEDVNSKTLYYRVGESKDIIFPSELQKVDTEILLDSQAEEDTRILRIKNLTFKNNLTLGVDELPEDKTYIRGKTQMESFAINLEGLDFTIGSLSVVAKGNILWKCALWNFTEQSCMGTWEVLQEISPGEEYNISLFPNDPGYVETYDAEQSLDVAMTALDEEIIVIAWINNETGFNASFEIWHTNGTLLVDQVNFETTGSAASRIDVEAINRTHFVLGLIDGPDQDLDFFIYDIWGNVVRGVTQLDATIGAIADVAVCELGDRFAVLNENTGDADADFYVRDNGGNVLVVQTAVDGMTTPGAGGQNLIDCIALNDTKWIYLFYDDADNDVTNALVNGSGSILVAGTDIDLDVGETGQVAGASFGNNRYAALFYDSTDDDISLRITQVTATNTLSIIYTGDIDLDAGTDSRVAATEVRNSDQSYVVAAWYDLSSGDIKAGVYNASGSAVTAPFTVTTDVTPVYKLLDVIGYNSMLGQGLCNYTFAITYTNASMNSVFETYWINGTRWNGECPMPVENVPPELQILFPPNNTINDTSSVVDFVYSVSDASDISNCSFYLNGELNMTNTSVSKDIVQAFTLELDNGEYTWEIECYDYFGNRNSSGIYNLNMSVFFYSSNAIDIDIDALDETTLVMAWIDGGVGNYLSFEIWNTDGTKSVDRVDVDTSGDIGSAVAVSSVNSTHFIISWIDGPANDLLHAGYTRTGENYIAPAALDTAIGTYADVDVCQLGDRYAIVDANGGDSDADFRIQSNTGGALVGESSVDTTITPSLNNQNLVSCSAINSSAWTYAFFDDADNDASMFARTLTGTAIGVAQDIDLDVGETGQVAVAGMRNNTIAYTYYNSVDASIYITVRELAGATWNTLLAPTAIDLDAGNESRVDVAEIEYQGKSYFVAAWYDYADTTIKAGVYNQTGNEITAPFVVSSNPTSAPSLLSVTGIHSTFDFGLCRKTFAIAYTNLSGYAVFRTFYFNGTIWDGACPEIGSPVVETVNTEALITLNAGALKYVACNTTINKGEDSSDINSVFGTLFRSNMSDEDGEDNNFVYKNSSCLMTDVGDNYENYTCGFSLYYFAANGSWNCTIKATNVEGKNGTNTNETFIDTLYAFNTSALFLDYGDIPPGSNSSDKHLNFTNFGNMPINITVRGFGGNDPSSGDGYALRCISGQNITVDNERYALAPGRTFAQKKQINSTPVDMNFSIPKQTIAGSLKINTSYWQMYIPPLLQVTQCNGTVVFTATAT